MSVPHHDGLFVGRVDDDLDEEIGGMAVNVAMRLKEEHLRGTTCCIMASSIYLNYYGISFALHRTSQNRTNFTERLHLSP